MNGIQMYNPGDDNYEAVEQVVTAAGSAKSAATERYNEIAEAFNAANTDAYLSILDKDMRLSNLEKVFFNRGLVRDTDYTLSRPAVDIGGKKLHREERPVLIRKLSNAVMRVV
jgi:hypothetical protein